MINHFRIAFISLVSAQGKYIKLVSVGLIFCVLVVCAILI